ncbi:helix-turn-helix domain-containing protein [Actinomadura rubrisoli]|uniref:XRE family transcriptional regulator n=1 Tax=Actinomadura rubrisoli TaxID=2530368 RepID=A0A4R5C3K4_9ACTN|nr:helix-turn-helix transcriptional regulator [Actinomadura rubrisoli]TDD92490.1 XRE family transcriptional regulator [Actinomadura rubrisoli]
MAKADTLDPDNNPWHWLAADLRVWRLERNLSQTQLAEILEVDGSTVSNYESATTKLPLDKAEILDRLWRTRGHFARIRRYAESAHDPNWFDAYTRYERQASTVKPYSALALHGLLQTPAYARALLVGGQVVDDIDRAVEERIARQEILVEDPPPNLWVLIKESVLWDPVGGPEVMHAQLAHLLGLSHKRNTMIRVVPRSLGAHPGIDGSFTLLTTSKGEHAWSEAVAGGRLVSDPAKLPEYRVRYERIGADALSRDSTRSLITKVMEAMQ